jgi:hypothetical protein
MTPAERRKKRWDELVSMAYLACDSADYAYSTSSDFRDSRSIVSNREDAESTESLLVEVEELSILLKGVLGIFQSIEMERSSASALAHSLQRSMDTVRSESFRDGFMCGAGLSDCESARVIREELEAGGNISTEREVGRRAVTANDRANYVVRIKNSSFAPAGYKMKPSMYAAIMSGELDHVIAEWLEETWG